MNQYRSNPFHAILGILIGAIFVLLLSACASGGVQKPSEQSLMELRDTACPITQAVILGLQLDPNVSAQVKEQLAYAEPFVTAGCAADGTMNSLHAMSDKAFPIVLEVIMKSQTLTPEQKQTALITLTTARIIISSYYNQAPAVSAPTGAIQ